MSPTFEQFPPGQLDGGTECHIISWAPPGMATPPRPKKPVPDSSFSEEIPPDIQPQSPLVQFGATSSCPVTDCLGEEDNLLSPGTVTWALGTEGLPQSLLASPPCPAPVGLLHHISSSQNPQEFVLAWIIRSCRTPKTSFPLTYLCAMYGHTSCLATSSAIAGKMLLLPNRQEKRSGTCLKILHCCFQGPAVRSQEIQHKERQVGHRLRKFRAEFHSLSAVTN